MALFTGSGVALVTPFSKNQAVDYEGLDQLLEYHMNHETDGIIICGTTGETSTLSEEEHIDVIQFAVERVKGRLPIIAGTGSNCTRTTIAMSKEAEKYGVDGLLIVTPYFNKTTQEGLVQHYVCVAKEVKIPIVMYNVGSRTGINAEPATVARIFRQARNVTGIKEASGNISQIAKVMQLTDGNMDLYAGNDDQIVPILALGGKGVISVLANIAPDEVHDICEDFFNGKWHRSLKLQMKAFPLISQLFCEVNPIPVKKALELMGMPSGGVRMPLSELSKEHERQLVTAMRQFGLSLI